MRNLTNPIFNGTLEEACAQIKIDHNDSKSYVNRIGYEVIGTGHREGEKHTLLPIYDSMGFPPGVGQTVEVSSLGLGSHWIVVRVAEGYPGKFKFYGDSLGKS